MKRPYTIVLSLLVLAAMVLPNTGCQPNPTVPPVVGKGNLEEKIKDKTPEPSASSAASGSAVAEATQTAAQNVQKSYQSGNLTVNINAAVELPATAKLPVVKVAPRKFTQAEADKIIKALFQGKQAYNVKEKMSKSEIEKQIIDMQAIKSQAKSENKDKIDQKIDMAIKSMQDQLKTAPETVPLVPSDGKFKTDELGGLEFRAIAELGKDSDANLDIYSSKTGKTCSVWFTNEEMGSSYLGNESKLVGNPRGVSMPLEQAKALAVKTVADVGSDLKLASISLGTQQTGTGESKDVSTAPQCYLFMFTREVSGVPTTYEADVGGNVPQEDIDKADQVNGDYIEPHPYERICIAIDDSGILEFQWTSPDTVLGTVSSDAQTLTFDQVMDTFGKQFFLHNALPKLSDLTPISNGKGRTETRGDYSKNMRDRGIFTTDSIGYAEYIKSCTFNIDRITLGLSRIAVKDKQDEFMLVPVWDFFGSVTVEYTPESGFQGFTTTNTNKSFLTINAIDGSIINRSYGY